MQSEKALSKSKDKTDQIIKDKEEKSPSEKISKPTAAEKRAIIESMIEAQLNYQDDDDFKEFDFIRQFLSDRKEYNLRKKNN